MKTKLYVIVSLLVATRAFAQQAVPSDTSYWSTGGLSTLTFSQVSLTNWAAGGENSTAINGAVNMFADYRRNRSSWENTLDLGYGLIRQGKKEDDNEFIKSNDILSFITKYGYQISEENDMWYLSALLDFRTQFTEGSAAENPDSVISRFMAPGYLTTGIGIDFKPNKVLSISYIPLTGKFTFVADQELADLGAYGVDQGSQFRAEFGSYFRVRYMDEIFKNVTLESRLELFSNYLDNFGVIDVNWQNGVMMKINEVLSATFTTHLIYDEDIEIEEDGDSAVQFKSVFGAGFAYSFGDSRKKKN